MAVLTCQCRHRIDDHDARVEQGAYDESGRVYRSHTWPTACGECACGQFHRTLFYTRSLDRVAVVVDEPAPAYRVCGVLDMGTVCRWRIRTKIGLRVSVWLFGAIIRARYGAAPNKPRGSGS